MTTKNIIKVLIADDHAIVREGLKQILADTKDIVVAGHAENGIEAIKLTREGTCHVLLLDISMPDPQRDRSTEAGQEGIPQNRSPHALDAPRRPIRDTFAEAGASGYLNKQSAPAELVNAIRQVAGGRKYISAALAQELANQISDDHETPLHETLSDREYQTLTMIASGKTVSDIANELVLSVKTISMYRSRLLQKMKLRHNAELTHYAIKNHLVD